ncbi:Ubiquitin carboxyl-terminal hydrolase 14 [Thelohanellus kitauei]|uniref:ubiquitinyl hydrolase 1 n=1 Tax=Thelohanellus kitauei TaxID=669202 RepID=A0A0C2J256_THEKT|nr:Ubiquitin carboxyl-terminal hydrolase 14 [Thelohanellus kitauei]
MKDVKFPIRFDASELCAPTLSEKLKMMRPMVHEYENRLSMVTDENALQALITKAEAGKLSLPEQKMAPGDSGSAIYQLVAVLTHEGRSTLSGHYIGWVKYGHKKWAKMDDSTVTPVEENDILKLSGGGESHSSYLLIYKSTKVNYKS